MKITQKMRRFFALFNRRRLRCDGFDSRKWQENRQSKVNERNLHNKLASAQHDKLLTAQHNNLSKPQMPDNLHELLALERTIKLDIVLYMYANPLDFRGFDAQLHDTTFPLALSALGTLPLSVN